METATNAAGEHVTGRDALPVESAQEWYTVNDLARRFQTSVRHVRRLADCGWMPWGVKLGQLRRWSRREIEMWEAGGCKAVRSARITARGAKLTKGGHGV